MGKHGENIIMLNDASDSENGAGRVGGLCLLGNVAAVEVVNGPPNLLLPPLPLFSQPLFSPVAQERLGIGCGTDSLDWTILGTRQWV